MNNTHAYVRLSIPNKTLQQQQKDKTKKNAPSLVSIICKYSKNKNLTPPGPFPAKIYHTRYSVFHRKAHLLVSGHHCLLRSLARNFRLLEIVLQGQHPRYDVEQTRHTTNETDRNNMLHITAYYHIEQVPAVDTFVQLYTLTW